MRGRKGTGEYKGEATRLISVTSSVTSGALGCHAHEDTGRGERRERRERREGADQWEYVVQAEVGPASRTAGLPNRIVRHLHLAAAKGGERSTAGSERGAAVARGVAGPRGPRGCCTSILVAFWESHHLSRQWWHHDGSHRHSVLRAQSPRWSGPFDAHGPHFTTARGD